MVFKAVLVGSNTHGQKPTFEALGYDRKEKKACQREVSTID